LKDKAFSTFLDQNLSVELQPENEIAPSTKTSPAQWPSSTAMPSSDQRKHIAVAALSVMPSQPFRRNPMVAQLSSEPVIQFSLLVNEP
jgi:hypothetical protein